MNILAELIARIEARRTENKIPCKNYATPQAAEKATFDLAMKCGQYFGTHGARWVVFFVPSWGRWVGAIDMTEMMSRKDFGGGYVGFVSDKGFFSY